MNIPKIILQQYPLLNDSINVQNFGNGHINDTFLIKVHEDAFILQKVNKTVFRTDILMDNFEKLIPAIEKFQQKNVCKLSPSFIKNKQEKYHSLDRQHNAWRLMEFIPDCASYGISPKPEISLKAAHAMGKFQLFLNQLDPSCFGESISGFHQLTGRWESFIKVLEATPDFIKQEAEAEIQFVQKHESIVHELEKLIRQKTIPLRITHNDPKLENLLFTREGRVLVIDLDTVMPGSILFDYGDMVRTFTSPAEEDDPNPAHVKLRLDHFEALTKGYLKTLKDALAIAEKTNLLLGAKAIIFEQIIRFLSDYLSGNIYYKVDYPQHNLIRAQTQIKLLSELLSHEDQLEKIIQHELL